jgi:hypothetical protein
VAESGTLPIIPALERLRQEDHKFKASLGNIKKPCLIHTHKNFPKEKNKTKQESRVSSFLRSFLFLQLFLSFLPTVEGLGSLIALHRSRPALPGMCSSCLLFLHQLLLRM